MTFTDFRWVEEYELGNGERGLKAAVTIPPDTLIGIFDGTVRPYAVKDGRLVDPEAYKSIVQLRWDEAGGVLYGLTSGEDFSGIDYVNHSCNANLRVVQQIMYLSSREICAGEPLVTDYRLWDFISEGLNCWCTPSACVI